MQLVVPNALKAWYPSSIMVPLLMIVSVLLVALQQPIQVEARSVMRSELPEPIPPQVFHEGFALVQVLITNHRDQPWSFDPEELVLRNPKGKKLNQAVGTDIAPRLVDYFRGGRPLYGAEAYGGGRIPRQTRLDSRPLPSQAGSSKVAATIGQELRDLFDSYRLQPSTLEAGESVQGFLYVKSEQSGTRLRGGQVEFPDGLRAPIR